MILHDFTATLKVRALRATARRQPQQLPIQEMYRLMIENDLNVALKPLAGQVFKTNMMYPYARTEFAAYSDLRHVAVAMRGSLMWNWLSWKVQDLHDHNREERVGWTTTEDDEWHYLFVAGS